MTKERLLGLVGVLWGGGILLGRLLRDTGTAAEPAYAAGQAMALVLGVLLFFVGLYYLITG